MNSEWKELRNNFVGPLMWFFARLIQHCKSYSKLKILYNDHQKIYNVCFYHIKILHLGTVQTDFHASKIMRRFISGLKHKLSFVYHVNFSLEIFNFTLDPVNSCAE